MPWITDIRPRMRSPVSTLFGWLAISALPLFGSMLFIALRLGAGQGLYYIAGLYAASLILNFLLLWNSELLDGMKVLLFVLSFISPIACWLYFILLLALLGLFEAT